MMPAKADLIIYSSVVGVIARVWLLCQAID